MALAAFFDHVFQDGSGAISAKELLGVMRAMGQNPTEDEVKTQMLEPTFYFRRTSCFLVANWTMFFRY